MFNAVSRARDWLARRRLDEGHVRRGRYADDVCNRGNDIGVGKRQNGPVRLVDDVLVAGLVPIPVRGEVPVYQQMFVTVILGLMNVLWRQDREACHGNDEHSAKGASAEHQAHPNEKSTKYKVRSAKSKVRSTERPDAGHP